MSYLHRLAGARSGREWLLFFLVAAALALLAMHPEARLVIAMVDAISLDLLVLVLAVQVSAVVKVVWLQCNRGFDRWYAWLLLPGFRLSAANVRSSPAIAAYAALAHISLLVCATLVATAALHEV
jgi:hypothetical protein